VETVVKGAYLVVNFTNNVTHEKNLPLENKVVQAGSMILEKFNGICQEMKSRDGGHISKSLLQNTRNFVPLLGVFLRIFKEWRLQDEKVLTARIKYIIKSLQEIGPSLGSVDDFQSNRVHLEYAARLEYLQNRLVKLEGESTVPNNLKVPESQATTDDPIPVFELELPGWYPDKMTNEQMAYEVLLDPLFQLSDDGNAHYLHPGMKSIRDCFRNSFWQCMLDDLKQSPPDHHRTFIILNEIRQGVAGLANDAMKQEINLIIDIRQLKVQISQGLFSWSSTRALVHAIFEVFKKVQAPKRDAENNEIFSQIQLKIDEGFQKVESQPAALCFAMEKLFGMLYCMKIDASNARLRIILPVLLPNGVEYMRNKFEFKLRSNTVSLQRTRRIMDNAVTNMHRHFPHLTVHLKNGTNDPAIQLCHIMFFTNIFQGSILKEENVPETLAHDIIRLGNYQRKIHYFAIMVNIFAFLKRNRFDASQEEEVGFFCFVACITKPRLTLCIFGQNIRFAVDVMLTQVKSRTDKRVITETLHENITLAYQITNPEKNEMVKSYIKAAFDISNPVTELM
jgi:hypothetical protein